jgi:hypothetical protein
MSSHSSHTAGASPTSYQLQSAPPPTHNNLSTKQKAQLRRSNTKLTRLLGAAPQVLDEQQAGTHTIRQIKLPTFADQITSLRSIARRITPSAPNHSSRHCPFHLGNRHTITGGRRARTPATLTFTLFLHPRALLTPGRIALGLPSTTIITDSDTPPIH